MDRHDETVCLANEDHASSLDEKPAERFILDVLEVAVGSRALHDLANLTHGEVQGRPLQLLDQLLGLPWGAGVGLQIPVNGKAHCSSPWRARLLVGGRQVYHSGFAQATDFSLETALGCWSPRGGGGSE